MMSRKKELEEKKRLLLKMVVPAHREAEIVQEKKSVYLGHSATER